MYLLINLSTGNLWVSLLTLTEIYLPAWYAKHVYTDNYPDDYIDHAEGPEGPDQRMRVSPTSDSTCNEAPYTGGEIRRNSLKLDISSRSILGQSPSPESNNNPNPPRSRRLSFNYLIHSTSHRVPSNDHEQYMMGYHDTDIYGVPACPSPRGVDGGGGSSNNNSSHNNSNTILSPRQTRANSVTINDRDNPYLT